MLGDLTGRTAVVTGGGKGVGRAIAIALAAGGADVALADIDVDSAGRCSQGNWRPVAEMPWPSTWT